MRTARTNYFRIVTGVGVLLLLAGAPMMLGLTRPAQGADAELPGIVGAYASGLHALGLAGMIALPLAFVFTIWVMARKRRQVNRKFLSQSARSRRNMVENTRTLAIIIGASGLIVGSLAALYAAMIAARPDLYWELPLPFFTFQLAIPCLLISGALYAAGRIGG